MKAFSRILILVLAISLTACSSKKSIDSPFTTMAGSDTAPVKKWRTGYEWVAPENDTPVILVADYRHVLTATPPPSVYTTPAETEISAGEVIEEPAIENASASQPTEPEPQASFTRVAQLPALPEARPTETSHDRAWRRFCNNGENMTDADIGIIMAGGDIPDKFAEDCFPPK